MAETNPIADSLTQSVQGPKSVRVEGAGDSTEHSISDQIKAAKFLPPASLRRRVGGGMKFTKAAAGGAIL